MPHGRQRGVGPVWGDANHRAIGPGVSPTPSIKPSHEPGRPPTRECRREDAAEVGVEITAPPLRVEALPQITRQLYDVAQRICQVEAQQLRDAEVRTHQAEEVLPQALQALQSVRAEQWKMMRDVTQSVGELLQATGQLLQLLPQESRKGDEEVPPTYPRASHGVGGHHDSEPRPLPPGRDQTRPTPVTGQPSPQT